MKTSIFSKSAIATRIKYGVVGRSWTEEISQSFLWNLVWPLISHAFMCRWPHHMVIWAGLLHLSDWGKENSHSGWKDQMRENADTLLTINSGTYLWPWYLSLFLLDPGDWCQENITCVLGLLRKFEAITVDYNTGIENRGFSWKTNK